MFEIKYALTNPSFRNSGVSYTLMLAHLFFTPANLRIPSEIIIYSLSFILVILAYNTPKISLFTRFVNCPSLSALDTISFIYLLPNLSKSFM